MMYRVWMICILIGGWVSLCHAQTAPEEPGTTKGSKMVILDNSKPPATHPTFAKKYSFERGSNTVYDTLLHNKRNYRSAEIPKPSQRIIQDRLDRLTTIIQMDHNIYVQRYIEAYTLRKREQVSRMLGLSRVYFPMFEAYLDREGMPMELKYLSVVESALNPHARSWVGATGLWQFMYQTGRQYGLEVNSFVDERKDPDKATQAAIAYLKKSHQEFGDWLLAIASYNCGPGNVRRAIMRSGGKRNFWDIRAYLPRETRGYVPAFIAAAYTFEYAAEHNLYPLYVDFEAHQDTVHVRRMDITLSEIATMTGARISDLRHLNPELKLERVPYMNQPYVLRVPAKVADYFARNQREIASTYGKKRDARYTGPALASTSTKTSYAKSSYAPYTPPKGTTKVTYTVQTGDVVGSIAEKYGVSARQISYWNNLRRYRIKVGQKLKIHTKYPKGIAISPRAVPANRPVAGPGEYHTVRSGDTLWGLAKQYDVSVETLQRLNRGTDTRNLKLGQQVRIK